MNLIRIIKRYFLDLKNKKRAILQNIAAEIGYYYLDKNYDVTELYPKTRAEISTLGITQIEFKKGNIIITLTRPGLLIGRNGDNINALEKFLRLRIKYKKLLVEEDQIISWLYPYSEFD